MKNGNSSKNPRIRPFLIPLVACFAAFPGCSRDAAPPDAVVLYTSVDQQFAEQVLADFSRRTGIRVDAVYDAEAGKTTGFVRRLQREANRPRCDVWWSSEPFGTIELARAGVVEPLHSAAAADIPDAWKDPEGRWIALAARARVIAYHKQRFDPAKAPQTWEALAASDALDRLAVANPQFGTTRGHVAAAFAAWGPQRATALLQKLRDQKAQRADGNAHAVRLVASGAADWCMTDTDDVWIMQARGEPLGLVYPRLTADGPVVWMPCTVARVRGGPNPHAAQKLIDYLVSAEVERALALSDSRNVPVRPAIRRELGYEGPHPEPLAWETTADALPEAMRIARELLLE